VDLKELGCEGVGWVQEVQGRDQLQAVVNTAIKLWVP
jgi:hypothetical protein